MFDRILVGLDDSPAAFKALRLALHLAKQTAGDVHAVSVVERLPMFAATVGETEAEARFGNQYFLRVEFKARQLAADEYVQFAHSIAPGSTAKVLARIAAAEHRDLIVMGATKHSCLYNRLLGSTASRLIECAPCALLIAR